MTQPNTADEESRRLVCCDNCDWSGTEDDCVDAKYLHARLTPGGIVPAGECPECGALAYLTEVSIGEAPRQMIRDLLGAIGNLVEQVEQMKGMFPDEDGAIAAALENAGETVEAVEKQIAGLPGGAGSQLAAYRKLHDGLSDMIEGGRLTADMIPDDYDWLIKMLAETCQDPEVANDFSGAIEASGQMRSRGM